MPRPNGGPRLVRKGDRAEWYIQRTIPGRGTRRISTGTTDRAEAERILTRVLIEQAGQPVTADPYVAEIIGAYIAARTPQIARPVNLTDRAARLNRVLGPIRVSALNADKGDEYRGKREAEGVGAATIGDELALVNAAMKWAAGKELVAPLPPLRLPPRPPARERWLTPTEAGKLIAACKEPHVRLFIVLMLSSASRPGALLDLKWTQVDFPNRRLHLNPPGRAQTTKRRATVPLSDDALGALRAARQAQEAREKKFGAVIEWVIAYRGRHVGAIKKAFARAAERAGIDDVTPHTLRHTAATWMAQDGVSMFEIAGILGHTTARTTELYAKHSPEHLRSAVAVLGRRVGTVMGQK